MLWERLVLAGTHQGIEPQNQTLGRFSEIIALLWNGLIHAIRYFHGESTLNWFWQNIFFVEIIQL